MNSTEPWYNMTAWQSSLAVLHQDQFDLKFLAILLYNQNSKAVCHVIMSHKGHNCDKTQLATRIHSLQLEWQVSFIHLSNNKHFMSPQGYASLVTAAEPPYRN